MIWVRHSGGPPFRRAAIPGYYCYNKPNPNPNLTLILTLTLTVTPGSPEWRPSGMADLRNGGPLPLQSYLHLHKSFLYIIIIKEILTFIIF